MNLKKWIGIFAAPLNIRWRLVLFSKRFFGQSAPVSLDFAKPFYMPLLFARKAAICFCQGLFLIIPVAVFGQGNYYATNGTEYSVVGSLAGDQVFPDVAVTPSGGFVVWQDNATDGSGWGLSARKLDGTLSGVNGTFRVNVTGTNDQENARVALLKGGGAVFAWQGGLQGYQSIYARFLTSSNTWTTTNDVLVNMSTNNFQINPAVAVLNNSNIVVVWAGYNQAGSNSLLDVFGQMFTPAGQPIGTNFLVNQFTSYNQRTPAVAALTNGGFVVAWVSEQERQQSVVPDTAYTADVLATMTPSVDVYARLYDGRGVAQGDEFLVNADSNPCADPSLAAGYDGGFMVAWDARDMTSVLTNSLDIYARPFSGAGVGGAVTRVNSYLIGDQYVPRISSIGTDYFIVWTSLGQDGSDEGVYGQFLRNDGTLVGSELRVNTTTVSQQIQPVVTSDGANQFVVVWSSYTASQFGFDLFAQRYVNVASSLQSMAAPFINAPFILSNNVYQPQLEVSWPVLLGISVSNYEVYVDGASTPAGILASNQWTMAVSNGLTAGSTHSFAVDYVTTDGRRSPISPSASGTAWGGLNWGGIPYEWMQQYFGSDVSKWPSATADTDGDGMDNLQEFTAGTIPTNAASALMMSMQQTGQGIFVNWSTIPGQTYQVQVRTSMTSAWSNLGAPRFAAGASDSIYVGMGTAGYYRVELLRQ